ncbi:MAG: hypothetical protein ACLPY5_05835 [Candidatus Bathyarchaeia archaeon]
MPAASITYAPGNTFPTIKPPVSTPALTTQAADVTALEELENEQVVSVGEKPVPLTATSTPIGPLAGLK